jgi:hypothetical protein
VLWRTDRIIAELRMRHLLVGMGLRALAALIATFGLLMLELATYFALIQIWSTITAAAILGAINFAIAAILLVMAGRPPAGRELELANEIHGSSVGAPSTRGAGAAIAGVRYDPPSVKRSSAAADRAADHDHHSKPEEARSTLGRRGKFGRAKMIVQPPGLPGWRLQFKASA